MEFCFSPEYLADKVPSERLCYQKYLLPIAQRHLTAPGWQVYHNIPISGKYHKQKEGEIDFLLIGPPGVVVVEVKGGKINYHNNQFFRENIHSATEPLDSPIFQARDNREAIIAFLNEKLNFNPVVISIVIFPECAFSNTGITETVLDANSSPETTLATIQERFNSTKKRLEGEGVDFIQSLSSNQRKAVTSALFPSVRNTQFSFDYLQELKAHNVTRNIRILRGLISNQRTLIQTPIGGTKFLYVVDQMVEKQKMFHFKKGLYLSWNLLLAEKMQIHLKEANIHWMEAYSYVEFLNQYVEEPLGFDADFKEVLTKIIIDEYDFILIDEGQELFSKGLFELIYSAQGDIDQGAYTIFYDLGTHPDASNPFPSEEYGLFRQHCAYFHLGEEMRMNRHLALQHVYKMYNQKRWEVTSSIQNLVFKSYQSSSLFKTIKAALKNLGSASKDSIVLFTTNGLNYVKSRQDISQWNGFTHLQKMQSYIDQPNKYYYTTALSFRGLMEQHVLIVTGPLDEFTDSEWHQISIAASRSSSTIHLLYPE